MRVTVTWTWDDLGRYLAGIAGCLALGFFAFVAGDRVPLLAMFDLGIHELGHLLAMPLPQFVTILAGSALQVAVPAGLSAYFFSVRGDTVAAAVTLAWAGTSAKDVAVYAADAPYQALPLIYPNAIHDWAWLLGPQGLDAMGSAGAIAATIAGAGALAVVAAIVVLARNAVAAQRTAAAAAGWERRPGPAAPLPVRPARRTAPPRSTPRG